LQVPFSESINEKTMSKLLIAYYLKFHGSDV